MNPDDLINWTHLPSIPDADGLAGLYAGVSYDNLLVAGGCNFPGDARPWNGGIKRWYDSIYILENLSSSWRMAGKLPRPVAYGVSLTWNNKMICIGGRDNDKFYPEAFMISFVNGSLIIENLPDLPAPFANGCGVVAGDIVYVAGGQTSATDQQTLTNFWALDLSEPADGCQWKVLEPLPGFSRMLSVAATCGKSVYVFSGVHLPAGENPKREYLSDAWKYDPDSGWIKLPALPNAVVGAPGPATQLNGRFLLLGGDDGIIAGANIALKEAHPGFTRKILRFDPGTGEWEKAGALPDIFASSADNNEIFAPVTTPSVEWQGLVVIPAGEVKPGLRTRQVIAASFEKNKT